MILERAIINPRHIEIQIMADRYGNAVYIGERDCSIQRRHQKVVEEAPSPAVSPELRARMGETAVTAVKAIHYEGAGTLEFLLDQDGNFYFMEMNTRLQVEHPVTESITGLDLVELQLRVAAGQPLPLSQDDIVLKGHSIEVRLCAESPSEGFMPQSGTMALWHMPDTLRVEDAVESGSEIPPFYDSMIAKLISTGADREEARRRLVSGLKDATALGVETNQAFLSACLEHPTFIQGRRPRPSLITTRMNCWQGTRAPMTGPGYWPPCCSIPPTHRVATVARSAPLPIACRSSSASVLAGKPLTRG